MCGLFGIVSLTGAPLDHVRPDLQSLKDRGPDNIGEKSFPLVSFYHTRLAVVATHETSNQPIVSEAGVLICNGEIFNFKALRADSGEYRYRTSSDCEAVLHVYAEFGVEGISRLDGFFSCALYDPGRQRVVLHRDAVGKKPLFVMVDGGRLIFSSNVTAIVANASKRPTLDLEQVEFFRQHAFVNPSRSIFQEIAPVLPGQTITIDLRSGAIERSWLHKPPTQFDGDWQDERFIQTSIEGLVRAAVQKRIDGLEQPVLIFSGGIDSTVIASELCRLSSTTRMVSMRQPLPWMNDEPYARYAAWHLKKRIVFVNPWNDLYQRVEDAISKIDQPLAVMSYIYLSLLTREARQFGNVLLTGDGADEVFYAYRPFSDWQSDGREKVPPMIHTGPPHAFALSAYGVNQGMIDLVGHAFVKVDKATAEHQMEARCPFLDWDLLSFLRAIPVDYWTRQSELKHPLKAMLRARGFPDAFVNRKKIGFALPFRYLMIPKLAEIRERIDGSSPLLKQAGVRPRTPASLFGGFQHFEGMWREYVLASYLARVQG
jgi:asparagine synthase (glutamine-hydrolysing)